MRRNNLMVRFYYIMVFLFSSILAIWILFFLLINHYNRESAKTYLNRTAALIMNDLEKEFTGLERLVFTMSQSPDVKSFVTEKDIPSFFEKSSSVDRLLQNSNIDQTFIDSVVCYTKEGHFYRHLTPIGNTAAKRIFVLMSHNKYPDHIILNSDTENLIGYGGSLYEKGSLIGAVAVMVNSDTLAEKLYNFDSEHAFCIGIAVGDKILVSNRTLSSASVRSLTCSSAFFTTKKIGVTPYQIIIFVDRSYMRASYAYFLTAASVTTLAFIIALLYFGNGIRKQFLLPMTALIRYVENLDMDTSNNALPRLDNPAFLSLIEKINEMLVRLETKTQTIRQSEIQIKNAVIQRHKAVIYSLKKQINAHFTVNTINIIKILVSKKELDYAKKLCDGLSTLIRYAHDEDEFINAWDEFLALQNYINIMNIRYKNKFQAEFEIDDRFMDYTIPRMLLQPIIENALIHGYRDDTQDCKLEIIGELLEDNLKITVKDYGAGIPAAQLEDLRIKLSLNNTIPEGIDHIALLNINCRIKSYYGSAFGIEVNSTPDCGTAVSILLGISKTM